MEGSPGRERCRASVCVQAIWGLFWVCTRELGLGQARKGNKRWRVKHEAISTPLLNTSLVGGTWLLSQQPSCFYPFSRQSRGIWTLTGVQSSCDNPSKDGENYKMHGVASIVPVLQFSLWKDLLLAHGMSGGALSQSILFYISGLKFSFSHDFRRKCLQKKENN